MYEDENVWHIGEQLMTLGSIFLYSIPTRLAHIGLQTSYAFIMDADYGSRYSLDLAIATGIETGNCEIVATDLLDARKEVRKCLITGVLGKEVYSYLHHGSETKLLYDIVSDVIGFGIGYGIGKWQTYNYYKNLTVTYWGDLDKEN